MTTLKHNITLTIPEALAVSAYLGDIPVSTLANDPDLHFAIQKLLGHYQYAPTAACPSVFPANYISDDYTYKIICRERIDLIKSIRAALGYGLKESKDYMEANLIETTERHGTSCGVLIYTCRSLEDVRAAVGVNGYVADVTHVDSAL